MAQAETPQDEVNQVQWLRHVRTEIGTGQWVVVYSMPKLEDRGVTIFCALIPEAKVHLSLSDPNWDALVDHFHPGTIDRNNGDGTFTTTYHRFGDDDGIEPLVYGRYYHGLKPGTPEVIEEFRLFFNLYHDTRANRLIGFTKAGDEEEVAVIEPRLVKIRLSYLKEFLAVKNMRLAIFWNSQVETTKTLQELGLNEERRTERFEDTVHELIIEDNKRTLGDRTGTFSLTYGKKLIKGNDVWPEEHGGPKAARKYEDFIIGSQPDGRPLTFTSDPDKLANFFGANPGAPFYVTPVHFRKDVLLRYYGNPSKFSVTDGYLRCAGRWGLRLDNNDPKYVIVMLGDLGRDLPESEQGYWKSFNVIPEGGFSE